MEHGAILTFLCYLYLGYHGRGKAERFRCWDYSIVFWRNVCIWIWNPNFITFTRLIRIMKLNSVSELIIDIILNFSYLQPQSQQGDWNWNRPLPERRAMDNESCEVNSCSVQGAVIVNIKKYLYRTVWYISLCKCNLHIRKYLCP